MIDTNLQIHLIVLNSENYPNTICISWKFGDSYVLSFFIHLYNNMPSLITSTFLVFSFLVSFLLEKNQVSEKQYLLGQFDPTVHPDFIKPADTYTKGSARNQWMRKEAYIAFIKMAKEAKKEGISLVIISATRPFAAQKAIWERKWKEREALPELERAKNILLFSSMPGTSRHHWGSDIDINELSNAYFTQGNGLKEYEWLRKNASKYGFCQTYTSKTDGKRTGYEEEKWHWSYLPVSRQLTNLYKEKLSNGDIKGFTGAESAELIDIKTKYVLGINPECQ